MTAAVKVVTENPLIILPRYQKSAPLTNRENIPSVKKFIGIVRMVIIGCKNILKRVRHAPTIRQTHTGLTVTPEMSIVVAQTAIDNIIQCIITFIIMRTNYLRLLLLPCHLHFLSSLSLELT